METVQQSSVRRTALVVGGTSGIGRASAIKLAQRGYDVIVVGRNPDHGDSVRQAIELAGVRGVFLRADMSLMSEVRRVAEAVRQEVSALHVLIHCADVLLNKRQETAESLELSFATNFLSRFLLNDLLLDLLKAAGTARILHVAAPGLPFKINLAQVPPPPGVSSFQGHNLGQGANNLYGVELGARLAGTGVSINVMNPGMVDTDIRRRSTDMPLVFKLVGLIFETVLKSKTTTAERSADEVVKVALSPETAAWNGMLVGSTGRLLTLYAHDLDPDRRRELWARSEQALARLDRTGTNMPVGVGA